MSVAVEAWPVAEPGPVTNVTVWRVGTRLNGPARAAALALLTDDEQARAGRFLREDDRDRSIAARAALRLVLAGTLGRDPRAVALRPDAAGKPHLAPMGHDTLSFNVSHSGDWALVVVAPGPRVGVDVEAMRPIPDPLSLARLHFAAAETGALASLPSDARLAAFYACWTRKEAFVKALGAGLGFGLARFTVAVPPQPAALLAIDGSTGEARRWSLVDLPFGSDTAAALAVEERGTSPTLHSLAADRLRAPG